MPPFYYNLTHLGSGAGSPRASQAVAYIIRQEQAYNTARTAYGWETRALRPTYEEDLTYATWGHLPAWAENKPVPFFAAADAYERVNGRRASVLVVQFPRVLSQKVQVDIAREWCALQYPAHPYVVALHETRAFDGGINPHAHIVYSIRREDGIARTPAQHFARWNAAHPERGGAQKDLAFDAYGYIRAQRHAWSDLVNWHVEAHGHATFCDPRSLHAREIPRSPEPVPPSFHGLQAKHRGIISPQWQALLDQRGKNQVTRPLEEQKAREWWAYRKALLGAPTTPDALRVALQRNSALEVVQFQHPGVRVPRGETPLSKTVALLRTEIRAQGQARAMGRPLSAAEQAHGQQVLLRVAQMTTHHYDQERSR